VVASWQQDSETARRSLASVWRQRQRPLENAYFRKHAKYSIFINNHSQSYELRPQGHARGRQDDVAVIVVVVRSWPTSSVRSVYASCRPVDSSSPTSSRLAKAECRTAGCMTTGTRPSSLFINLFPLSPPPSSPSPLPPPSSSPSLSLLTRHPHHRCPLPCRPLRRCPHHRPRAFVVRHHPLSCSCPPPAFNTPVAS